MAAVRPIAEMTRRTAIGALAAGGVGFALWPRESRSASDIPSDRQILTYWEKWTGAEGAALQRVVDRFNASQDRLWVRRVPVSELTVKAIVAIGGGDPPDVVGLFNYNIPQYAEANAILPLDDFPGAEELTGDHYAPAVRDLLRFDGRQWAGVATCHTLALYYNRAFFREAGLDPDDPPKTIDELNAAAELLTRYDDRGGIERAGFLQNVPKWWPFFWTIMFGGRLYDEETNQATLMTPENLAAYDWVHGYPERYGRDATSNFVTGFAREFHSLHDPFMSGRLAMVVQGPWMANFIRTYVPDLDYGCCPVPVAASIYDPKRPTGLLEADVLMIPRGCADPEASFEFIRFMQRQDVQEELATDHCKSSPLRNVSDSFIANHPNRYVHVHDAITKSPAVVTAPKMRVWQQYHELLEGAFDAIWAGDAPRPELQRVQDRVQSLLDTVAERKEQRAAAGLGSTGSDER